MGIAKDHSFTNSARPPRTYIMLGLRNCQLRVGTNSESWCALHAMVCGLVDCSAPAASTEILVGVVPETTVVCRKLPYRVLEMRYACCFRADPFTAAQRKHRTMMPKGKLDIIEEKQAAAQVIAFSVRPHRTVVRLAGAVTTTQIVAYVAAMNDSRSPRFADDLT